MTTDRPLNKRGQQDGPRMGELVREHRLTPDVIISSDAVRARLTAEAVAEAARYTSEILLDSHLYIASAASILAVLRTVRETNVGTVMIVGHNPGLEELVAQLTGEQQDLPTAASRRLFCQSIGGAISKCRLAGRSWASGDRRN
jgi:phosphohistidine phosphatase